MEQGRGNEQLQIGRLTLGSFQTNSYLLTCPHTSESVLVDAPAEAWTLLEAVSSTRLRYVLITHCHADHTRALRQLLSSLNVPLCAHRLDSQRLPVPPDILLEDGEEIAFGEVRLRVLHTPGHTPGSLSFSSPGRLFSGDTIFPGGPGKTGSPADLEEIIRSITTKIFVLPDDTAIYPGHGDGTTVGKEKELFASFASRPRNPHLCGDVLWLSSR